MTEQVDVREAYREAALECALPQAPMAMPEQSLERATAGARLSWFNWRRSSRAQPAADV